MQRVTDLSDPRRCKGRAPDGQCRNKAVYGSEYCRAHGGKDLTEVEQKRGYLLAKAEDQAHLARVSDKLEPVKELRDVIALQHMLIEKRWNSVKNDTDLLQHCGVLNQLIQTMERLVNICHRIETNLGELLARNAIINLAKELVAIVIDELEGIEDYEAIIDRITQRLIETIRQADNTPPETQVLPPP
jgi:hypothetical protein